VGVKEGSRKTSREECTNVIAGKRIKVFRDRGTWRTVLGNKNNWLEGIHPKRENYAGIKRGGPWLRGDPARSNQRMIKGRTMHMEGFPEGEVYLGGGSLKDGLFASAK